MARWTQQSTAPWCLFNSTTGEVGSTDVVLGHAPSGVTDKGLGEEEALFNCFDGSWIRDFGNAWHQGYGKSSVA